MKQFSIIILFLLLGFWLKAQKNDVSNLQQIQTILQTESMNNLSSASINTLLSMAHNPFGLSWVMAKNVLQENGYHNYPYWIEEPIEPRIKLEKNNLVKIFPNPSNGLINIILPNFVKTYSISLSSIDGKIVYNQEHTNSSLINITNLNSGLYLYRIVLDNGSTENGKIIIEK